LGAFMIWGHEHARVTSALPHLIILIASEASRRAANRRVAEAAGWRMPLSMTR